MKSVEKQKNLVAIHDLSGFGKCSLTIALPILSAAGIETTVLPSVILSTHTGGITGFTYLDLTDEMAKIIKHWKSLDLKFDAIYSGFLGKKEQIDLMIDFFDYFGDKNECIKFIDPVMADNGKIYSVYDDSFVQAMIKLCPKADVISPNITEACLLVGQEYKEGPYSKEYIEDLLHKLAKIGPKTIILTGVFFDEEYLGAATYEKESNSINYAFSKRYPGWYHGTGDLFASVFLASIMQDNSVPKSLKIAVDFVSTCIKQTYEKGSNPKYGIKFEMQISSLLKMLEIN